MLKYVLILVLYAAALLAIGVSTHLVSPPGANPATALMAPAAGAILILVCAGLSLMINSNRLLGMIGIHVALLIPLLMAGGPAARLTGSLANATQFNDQLTKIHEGANGGVVISTVQATDGQRNFISRLESQASSNQLFSIQLEGDETAAEWHPAGYQTVGLASSIAVSLFAFVVLIMQRPPLPKRTAPESDAQEDS